MGFFGRRTVATVGRYAIRQNTLILDDSPLIWQPEAQEIEVCPAYLMEDEAAGDHAFGARFRPADGADSSLTIWAFPASCGPTEPGCYFVGYKTEYEAPPAWGPRVRRDGQRWSVSLYHGDLTWAERYIDLAEATEAARTAAAALIMVGPAAPGQHVPAETAAGWFEWDGQPW